MATYNEIIAYAPLATFSSNRATVSEMPSIVRRAQNYITARLDHEFFRDVPVSTTVDAAGDVDDGAFPATMLEIRSISAEVRTGKFLPLRPRQQEVLEAIYIDGSKGSPRHYTKTSSGGWKVYPAPGRTMNVKVTINVAPNLLTAGNQTNEISLDFPELFEFAVMREAAIFNADQNLVSLYTQETNDALTAANAQIARRKRDEVSQRPRDTTNITGG